MRIDELHLIAFGPFSGNIVNLSGGNAGLHIVFGQNESGKSSSLRALRQVLYGIPPKSTDNFKHAHPDMRIGAVLRASDGGVLKVLRRKGNTKTLRQLDQENELVSESLLQHYLGNINQATFETMFGIDHSELVSGGASILKGSGELGQLLFSAGAGIADLRNVLAALEKDYQDLYARNAVNRQINRQLSEYTETRRILKESELPNSEWEQHDQSLRQAQKQKTELDLKLEDLQNQMRRAGRLRDSIPLINERSIYDSEMATLSAVVLLPAGFEEDARNLLSQMLIFKREETLDTEKLANLAAELSGLRVPEGVIERAGAIEFLQQKRGAHRKAALDRLSLEETLVEEKERARACLRDLGRSDDFAQASTLRLSVQEKTRLRKLALERRALWQAYADAQALRQRTEQRLQQCRVELSKLDRLPACEKLAACYKHIQQDPQMEERSLSETSKLERQLAQILVDLRKLQIKNLPENISLDSVAELNAQLQSVLVPENQVIESFDKEISRVDKEIETHTARSTDISNELLEITYRLKEHELKVAAPTEADLFEIRKLRDTGWQLVLKSWKDKKEDQSEIAAYLGSTNNSSELNVGYEWALTKSDTIADRLRHEADHVALKIQLTAQVQKLTGQRQESTDKAAGSKPVQLSLQKDWQSIWADFTERPLTASAARLWITQFETARSALALLVQNKETTRLAADLVARSKAALIDALRESLWSVSAGEQLLLNLSEQAQQCLEKHRAQKQSQSELERELAKLQIDMSSYATTEQTKKAEIDSWAASWQPAVESLGLGPTTGPEELTAFLDRFEQFFQHFDQITSLQRRIAGIDRDAEQFSHDVSQTVNRVAPHLSNLPAEEAAVELFAFLKKAKETDQLLTMLKERQNELLEAKELRNEALAKLGDRLEQMIAEAGVSSENELLDAARKSLQKQRLAEMIDNYNRQLARLAEGAALSDYIQECQLHNPVDLESRINRLQNEIGQEEIRKDELQITIGRQKQILQTMDGSAKAADAAGRMQQILAGLGQDVEQYGRLKLSGIILKKAIDRYREKNQSPILKEASRIFALLSNGSFSALQEDFNEKGEPALFGMRAQTRSLLSVDGMSEGTRDQLYLALRLAGLSLYLEKNEALPFIVDDILVNFDDKRSLATLQVLSEFSRRTQIIMFTHHAHIVTLAREHLNPDHVFINGL